MKPPVKAKTADTESPEPGDDPNPSVSIAAMRRRVGAVVFLMMIAVLLTSTLLVIGGVLVFRNVQAGFWKRTDGVLLDAHIDRHVRSTESESMPDIPVVKYEYTVNGRRIVSDKWSPAGYGLDIYASVASLKKENPLTVYYNPHASTDSAVVLPPASIGYFPFVFGLGLFFILVVAMGGGALFAALHPDIAADPNSTARAWVARSLRAGVALVLTSLTGLITLITHSPGGWWQWVITLVAVAYVLSRPL